MINNKMRIRDIKLIHLSILIFTLFLLPSECKKIYFSKESSCTKLSEDRCLEWNSTIAISLTIYFSHYMCFPQETRVLTQKGVIKEMRELSVHDKILGYNFVEERAEFSEVSAWLHRDTDSRVEFVEVSTENNYSYVSSSGHNFAYFDEEEEKVGFKYADELEKGDGLIALEQGVDFAVKRRGNIVGQGMYAPYTQLNNFYIYPKQGNNQSSMILVHCLSQIQSPHQKQTWLHYGMQISQILGLNKHENKEREQYLHPIISILNLFNSRKQSKQTTKIIIEEGNGNGNLNNSNNNDEKQKQKEFLAIFSLFVNTMNDIFLL